MDKSIYTNYVLSKIVGTTGPMGSPNSRAYTHLLQKYDCVNTAELVYKNFTDSGNFGLNISGPSSNGRELAEALVTEM